MAGTDPGRSRGPMQAQGETVMAPAPGGTRRRATWYWILGAVAAVVLLAAGYVFFRRAIPGIEPTSSPMQMQGEPMLAPAK